MSVSFRETHEGFALGELVYDPSAASKVAGKSEPSQFGPAINSHLLLWGAVACREPAWKKGMINFYSQ